MSQVTYQIVETDSRWKTNHKFAVVGQSGNMLNLHNRGLIIFPIEDQQISSIVTDEGCLVIFQNGDKLVAQNGRVENWFLDFVLPEMRTPRVFRPGAARRLYRP